MNNFKSKIFYSFFVLLLFAGINTFSKSLNFEGLQKLSLNDIQTLTDTDIYSSEYNELKINDLIKELYNSDLIFDLKLTETKESYSIFIEENSKIENIYFNGNIRFDDEILKNIITSSINSFLNKDKISNDIDTIRSFYSSQGYYDSSVNVVTEKVNLDKINLIFQISESELSKISKINFFQRFMNLDKTFYEYKLLYKLLKNYKYIKINNKFVSKLFFLNLKYYRKDVEIFACN